MADNDKLEINFRDLARSATQYVFSSTFPSLERMLKTVKSTNEENRAQVENLNQTIESINNSLGTINIGLRKLNDTMAKSLGILGKILKSQSDGGSSGGLSTNTALGNISKAAGATLGAGAMFSMIENNSVTPPPPTPEGQQTSTTSGAQPSTPIAGGSQSGGPSTPPATATKAPTPSPAQPNTPAPQAKPEENTQTSGSRTLLIKASTISFEAGQIIFGGSSGGSGASSAGGGGGASTQPQQTTSSTSGQPAGAPATGGASQDVSGENGRLDRGQLTSIPGGVLQASAAQSYMAMVQAAGQENISWGITDSYRDYPTQVRLAREKGLYSQGGLAAFPGKSNHGWGRAVDLNFKQNPKAQIWLQQNAGRFGFSTIPREPWHWEYKGGGGAPSGGTMVAKGGDQSKMSGEGAPAGGAQPSGTSTGGSADKPRTGPSAPLGASPATGPAMAAKPEEKAKTASAVPVASPPAKGAQLNRESTNSEVASVTPPARASMNQISMGGKSGEQSDSLPNPKISNVNKAGNVEPEDAAQRYESLFGIKPKVPTGNSAKVA